MSLSNSLGLLGRKVGMMRLFTDDGDTVPVTVVDVSNNRVTQVKTQANDGYDALQVAFGSRKASRVTKPEAGHLAKAGVESGEILQEFRVPAELVGQYAPGTVVPASLFAVGQAVAYLIASEAGDRRRDEGHCQFTSGSVRVDGAMAQYLWRTRRTKRSPMRLRPMAMLA